MHRLSLGIAVSLLFAVLGAVPSAVAADPDPIDRALDDCVGTAEGGPTMGQVQCLRTAHDAWDRELNRVYGQLMGKLDPQSRTLLRDAQRQWLAFRDADRAFDGGPWTRDQGTLILVILNSADVDRVRDRAVALRGILVVFE
jgi:uncharacterized protein YecT (DUF1311 family)